MSTYKVNVVVNNKSTAGDPEGTTIMRDLVLKGGFSQVKEVRTGKFLTMTVDAQRDTEAVRLVKEICDSLRIYNPAVHVCRVWLEVGV